MRKIVILVLFICCYSLICAQAQQRKVTLMLDKKPIIELFKQIQQQSGYNIVYSDEVISDTMLVSVNFNQLPVSKILDSILSNRQLFYQTLSETMIVIGSKQLKEKERIEQTLISGSAVNPDGISVPFATVSLLENELQVSGAIASEQGHFQFSYAFKTNKSYSLNIS